jgi:hypothetical protein
VKFELDRQIRACCLSKPISYDDLLKSIQHLFGNHALASIESIRCVFSREDGLRLPITSDEDLQKVIAIAEVNGASKLNFLLTRKKSPLSSRGKVIRKNDEPEAISDGNQSDNTDDTRLDSPPPGTIAPQKRRTATTTPGISTNSKDGGLFIPETVR